MTRLLREAVIEAAELQGQELGAPEGEGLVTYLRTLAEKDSKSFSSLLGRAMPLQSAPVALPAVTDAASLVKATGTLAASLSNGDLSPHEASAIAGVLGVVQKAIETNELASRIAALEAATSKVEA